jgi:hypothetical protein
VLELFHNPSFICKCSDVSICEDHLGKHFMIKANHQYERIDSEGIQNEQSNLKNEIKNRISLLTKLKKRNIL